MSWMSRLITLWTCSTPSLLLVGLVGGHLGLGVGLQLVQTLNCSRWGTPSDEGVFEDGDVILGGLFNLYYIPPTLEHEYTRQPEYKSCTG